MITYFSTYILSKMHKKGTFVLSFFIFIFFCGNVMAQERIEKEVRVVKSYRPVVSDAFKINELPDLTDTLTIKSDVNYSIPPREISMPYEIGQIKAARMLGEPLSELYKNYVRVGMGNYVKPMISLRHNTLRSREYMWGTYLKHESSMGKVKLDDDTRSYAGYHDSRINVYGKKIWNNVAGKADIDFNNNTRHFYGFDPQDTILTKDNIRDDHGQNFLDFSTTLHLHSLTIDTNKFNYSLDGGFLYLQDAYKHSESKLAFKGSLDKNIGANTFGVLTGYSKYIRSDTTDYSHFSARPFIERKNEDWHVTAGVNITVFTTGNNTKTYFYPAGQITFNILDHFIDPYIGVDGGIVTNDYYCVTRENPFVTPGILVRPTEHQLHLYGGIKGNFSSKISYNFSMHYSVINNMYFYVNDYSDSIGNRFNVIYDKADVELTRYHGEITYQAADNVSFYFRGDLYNYTLVELEKPWHKPSHKVTLAGRYNIQDKILLNAEIIGIGKTFAMPEQANQSPIELEGTTDVNLDIEYRYSKVLSGFFEINNMFAKRYFPYHLYPTQQFNVMLGIYYTL